MIDAGRCIKGAKVIVLGLTFKENCPNRRSPKVADLVCALQDYGCDVVVYDPIAKPCEAEREYSINLVSWDSLPQAEAIVEAVSHKEYMNKPLLEITQRVKAGGVFIDIKSAFNPETLGSAGFNVWRL